MAERKFKTVESAEFIILGGEREDGSDPITMVEGTLIEKETMQMRNSDVGRYHLERDDGTPFTLLGAKLLDEKMVQVDVGDFVRITLEKETTRTSSGNQMKNFTVEVSE